MILKSPCKLLFGKLGLKMLYGKQGPHVCHMSHICISLGTTKIREPFFSKKKTGSTNHQSALSWTSLGWLKNPLSSDGSMVAKCVHPNDLERKTLAHKSCTSVYWFQCFFFLKVL